MAIDTLRRYIWLLDIIEKYGYIEFETIQEEWMQSTLNDYRENLPKRTFRNHITAIADQLGLYIQYQKGRGYYLSNVEDIKTSQMKQWMISSLSMYNILAECQDMKDKILFEEIPSSQKYISDIIQAIRDRRAITYQYQSHFSSEPHEVMVEPYCLKLFKQRWYLLARVPEYDELRIYALERMSNLVQTSCKYKIPKDFNAEDYFYQYYGVNTNGNPQIVRIKAIPLEAKYLRSLPLHPSQIEIRTTPEYSIFSMYLSPTWDFKQELLSRADQIEVLEPDSLREWMSDMIQKMSEKYK
jgi:predicted DNA-binding transcriptional regulator YafY